MNTLGGREIRTLAHDLFGQMDRMAIREAIKNFRSSGSLTTFVYELGEVIQTHEHMRFISTLRDMLPTDLQSDFTSLCRMNINGYKDFLKGKSPHRSSRKVPPDIYSTSYKTSRRPAIPKSFLAFPSFGNQHQPSQRIVETTDSNHQVQYGSPMERLDSQGDSQDHESAGDNKSSTVRTVTSVFRFHRSPPGSTSKQAIKSRNQNIYTEKNSQKKQLKEITLEKRRGESLGLNIKGGKEYRCGIYISGVDQGGQAHQKGVHVGDRVVRVNGISFVKITHQAAVHILSQPAVLDILLDITSRHAASSVHSEISVEVHQVADDLEGRIITETELRCSPHPSQSPTHALEPPLNFLSVDSRGETTQYETGVSHIALEADCDGYLGCSIRGGRDLRRPAVISHVDRSSPAQLSGVRAGDRVLSINNQSIDEMTHIDIVLLATSTRILNLVVQHRQRGSGKAGTVGHVRQGDTPYNIRRAFSETQFDRTRNGQLIGMTRQDQQTEGLNEDRLTAVLDDEDYVGPADTATTGTAADDGYLTETSNSCNLHNLSRSTSSQIITTQSLSLASPTQSDVSQAQIGNVVATLQNSDSVQNGLSSLSSDFENNIAFTGVTTSTPRPGLSTLTRKVEPNNLPQTESPGDVDKAITLSRRLRTLHSKNRPLLSDRPNEKPPPPPPSIQNTDTSTRQEDTILSKNNQLISASDISHVENVSNSVQSREVISNSVKSRVITSRSVKSRPSTIRMNLLSAPELYTDESEKQLQSSDKQISTLTASGLFEVLI